jgi:hypothetical protein
MSMLIGRDSDAKQSLFYLFYIVFRSQQFRLKLRDEMSLALINPYPSRLILLHNILLIIVSRIEVKHLTDIVDRCSAVLRFDF